MIRINLLPAKVSRKHETAKKQIAIFACSIALAVGSMSTLYAVTLTAIAKKKTEISAAETEIAQLKKKIGEIDNLKKVQEEVKKKLDILAQLRKGKSGPVERMLALSDSVPERLWITSYTEAGTGLKVDAVAYNEDLIADFIRKLESTKNYGRVELVVSEQAAIAGTTVKKFSITCSLK
ncbi:MAG TPA: PilN domain-containing protein [Verrucomicrobiae bacterium]|nr:PilN domain-containing protein [Verrucomicrobiae bacterium]